MKSLYSIYDSFLDEFLPPFVSKNDTMADLSYSQYLQEHPLHTNQVTKLFNIGTFDENRGSVGYEINPKLVKVYENKKEVKENGKDV